MHAHITFKRFFVKDGPKLLEDPHRFDWFETYSLHLESCLELLDPWDHHCDAIMGHTLVVVLYLKGFLDHDDDGSREYANKWWTLHLAECPPHPPHSDEILHLLKTPGWLRAVCNIGGTVRVIGWLKVCISSRTTQQYLTTFYRKSLTSLKPSFLVGKIIDRT